MSKPTLFLTVGLPGTGKTTVARRLEAEHAALRLTKDEWIKALYGHGNPEDSSAVVEGRLIDIGLRGLELGINVVIDFGLWSRDERSALRHAAAHNGAVVVMLYFTLPPAEQRTRLEKRLEESPHSTWPISDEELATYAVKFETPTSGEVDGSEPIDSASPGFASWQEWISWRWPSHVG